MLVATSVHFLGPPAAVLRDGSQAPMGRLLPPDSRAGPGARRYIRLSTAHRCLFSGLRLSPMTGLYHPKEHSRGEQEVT